MTEKTLSQQIKDAQAWAEKNLVGVSLYCKAIRKDVLFTRSGIKHALNFKRSEAKIILLYDLLSLVAGAKLQSKEADKKGRKQILNVYTLANEYKHGTKTYLIYIIIREVKEGVFHYDHGVVKEKEQQ